ncbi:MAG: exodeoxyribonuclease VII large subunit [Planctomycetota bacterium]|jgi:exodeoxyribonuclease VII large subunit|nr:exodeoxyribonuclease VII large subunit [Planctomycetota bacterium]
MRRGLRHPAREVAKPDPLTVSEVTRRIKGLLETGIGAVTVEGEVSGIKTSPSGHVYFSLKDEYALLDAVVWKSAATRMGDLPADGEKVLAKGRLAVYEPRGRYQLVVTSFLKTGAGDLWRRFEELKTKLAAEGLFDSERKVPLPESPKTVGIVTSAAGAALRDMLKILRRRAPNLRIVVAPASVQGKGAAAEIAAALAALDDWGGADVVVVGRGGGSLEDLWAFNEEAVARAIAAMRTPVVSAVGHETDFTIADFVADARAATPSEAAERIAPDQGRLRERIAHAAAMLTRALSGAVRDRRTRLEGVAARQAYRRPLDMYMTLWQRLDEAASRLDAAARRNLDQVGNRVEIAAARLQGLSPLDVLSRGYAVVLDRVGNPLVDAADAAIGDGITAILRRGGLTARVDGVEPGEPEKG